MSFDALPRALRSLIVLHMPTMDHVAVLVALRRSPERAQTPAHLASQTRLESPVVDAVLRDLISSRLVANEGGDYRYAPPPELQDPLDTLADMYQTKPVTLVRAMYDRPARAVTSFADAFRVRKLN